MTRARMEGEVQTMGLPEEIEEVFDAIFIDLAALSDLPEGVDEFIELVDEFPEYGTELGALIVRNLGTTARVREHVTKLRRLIQGVLQGA